MKYKKLNGGIKMENQKCQFCGNNEASVPIEDSETIKEIRICSGCYNTCFETETFIQELNCREIK